MFFEIDICPPGFSLCSDCLYCTKKEGGGPQLVPITLTIAIGVIHLNENVGRTFRLGLVQVDNITGFDRKLCGQLARD